MWLQLEHMNGCKLGLLVDIWRGDCTLKDLCWVENTTLNSCPIIRAAAQRRNNLIIADDLLKLVIKVSTPHERFCLVLLA